MGVVAVGEVLRILIAADTIDEEGLRESFDQVGSPNKAPFGDLYRAPDVIDMGFTGRLQITDGERTLFETEGEGPGEVGINILGVLFAAYFALEELSDYPDSTTTMFAPDYYEMDFYATRDGGMRATTSTRHWVVATRDEWRNALGGAFEQLRTWIRQNAAYLEDDERLRSWIYGGPPFDTRGPFA